MTAIANNIESEANGLNPELLGSFRNVRGVSLGICDPLCIEDYVIQSMPDVSPTKWHLAHTTWFFETFVLKPSIASYRPLDDRYAVLFNSYYESVGPMYPRTRRGLLSRPSVEDILKYRQHVDMHMQKLLAGRLDVKTMEVVELGMHHEQQHQELMLTDIKHVLSCNPLTPSYRKPIAAKHPVSQPKELGFTEFSGGIELIGARSDSGFCFDNEKPRHQVLLRPFALANRLVTNAEYQQFIDDGGYRRAELWLADGWAWIKDQAITRPLYWTENNQSEFTLYGESHLILDSPTCHVSYFEADAFARWAANCWPAAWARARLPSEAEWEVAARTAPVKGNFLDSDSLRPRGASNTHGLQQLYGDAWEWTASPYLPFPGFQSSQDALGEYNGKFMCNQFVLRGGSCVTPATHIRSTYRNFFPPHARWQFTGIRLAKDI